MMVKHDDTKSRILDSAKELFATRGYDATSVRDIATAANVNIAAVNYHFENKLNLFWQIFRTSMEGVESRILALQVERQLPADELAAAIFYLMNDNWMEVRNTFRMILSAEMPKASQGAGSDFCNGRMGPPGAEVLVGAMTLAVGHKVPEEALIWGVRTIFSQIVHMALVINTNFVKTFSTQETSHFLNPDFVAASIKEQTRAIISHLQNNADRVAAELQKSHCRL